MINLENIFLFIAKYLEGLGYSKFDKAGATIYGITEKYNPNEYNILKNAIETKNEEKIKEAIIEAYYSMYHKSKASNISDLILSVLYFDFYFNAGKHGVISLQELPNYFMKKRILIVDGDFGKNTKREINLFLDKFQDKGKLYWYYNYLRRDFYLNNPQKIFRLGWINRVQKLENYIFQNF